MRKKLVLKKITNNQPEEIKFKFEEIKPKQRVVRKPVTLANMLIEIHKRKGLKLLIPIGAIQKQAKLILKDYLFDDVYYVLGEVGNSDMPFSFTFKYVKKQLQERKISKKSKLF